MGALNWGFRVLVHNPVLPFLVFLEVLVFLPCKELLVFFLLRIPYLF